MKELLKKLCELDGVPGYEDEVRVFIEEQAKPYATSMEVDPVGNLIVFKKGAKERKRRTCDCKNVSQRVDKREFQVFVGITKSHLHTRIFVIHPRTDRHEDHSTRKYAARQSDQGEILLQSFHNKNLHAKDRFFLWGCPSLSL